MTRNAAFLLIVLAIVLIGGWFLHTHERVPDSRYVGWQGEAQYNDFLPAQFLLEELGVEADGVANLEPSVWLPDTADTIIVRLSPAYLTDDDPDMLLQWIETGGHLVLLAPGSLTNDVQNFVAEVGFEYVTVEQPTEEELESGDSEGAEASDEDNDVEFEIDLDLMPYRVNYLLDDEEYFAYTDELGMVVARRAFGDGAVTVVGGHMIFDKWRLDDSDHAKLFVDLTIGGPAPGKVWLIYSTSFVPLWALIWNAAPAVVLTGCVLLLAWLWSAIPAFGPRYVSIVEARRSISEHMSAAGRFMWKKSGARYLTAAAIRAVLHAAERRSVGIGRKAAAEQARLLAGMTGSDPNAVLTTITEHPAPTHREFTAQMQKLQQLRKRI